MGELDSKIIVAVEEVVAGTNVTVDNTDPTKPIVNATGGGGSISIFEASNSVPASTSSSTYSNLLGMSITPPSAGEYALWFTSETQATNASTESQYTIFVNGVEVLGSSKSIKIGSNSVKTEVTLLRKINYVSGSIDIRFRKSNGAGIVTSLNRTLMLIC